MRETNKQRLSLQKVLQDLTVKCLCSSNRILFNNKISMNNNYRQVTSPRRWHRSFPISLALIRTTNNYLSTSKPTERILEQAALYHGSQDRLHLKWRRCWLHCPLPGQHTTLWRTAPPWAFRSSSGKREAGRDSEHCHPQHCVLFWLCECHYSKLALWDCRGIFWAQSMGIWPGWRKGERVATTSPQRQSLYLLPKWSPASGVAHRQQHAGGALRPGNSVDWRSAWLRSSKEECGHPTGPLCPHPGKKLSHNPTYCRECLSDTSDEKSWQDSLETLQQSSAQTKSQADRADQPQNKARTGHGGFFCATHNTGWGMNS